MSAGLAPIVLAAGDEGAHSALRPLADAMPSFVGCNSHSACTTDAYWLALFRQQRARGLVCGTSDSPAGRALEASARRAAALARLPIIVIEDFPGNYYEVPGGPTDVLVVESAPVVTLTRSKFGSACPQTKVLSQARYDPLRNKAHLSRAMLRDQATDPTRPVSVLWAGQPETIDCLLTLRILIPTLASRGFELQFKAHPRDAGYRTGAYDSLLADAGIICRDVTHLTSEQALLLAPRLVITQFSSIAIEAGFAGIPSLNVLLPNAGGARLMEKKGYKTPPHCVAGAAGYVMHGDELADALHCLIDVPVARENLMRSFDSYFCAHEPMLPHLVALIEKLFQNKGFPPESRAFG